MARSTFSGPILSGNQRFGVQRDVGTPVLSQYCYLDFSNSTVGTTGYGGASGQFVIGNNMPNANATIYTAQAGVGNNSGPTAGTAPTADTSGTNYRGCVFWLPSGSTLQEVLIDQLVQPTDGSNNVTAIQPYISNAFATTTGNYATSASITGGSIGRTACTFSAAQYANALSTLKDVQNVNVGMQPGWFSQIVVSLKMTVASLSSVNAGKFIVTVRYLQNDQDIGSTTAYPYGNFD